MERRTLIRLLVGVGIGIPILVEILTFGGLVGRRVFDGGDVDDGDGDVTGDGGDDTTQEEDTVGVGDELLPATPQAEVLADAAIEANGDRTFSMTVSVDNVDDQEYEFRLNALTTDAGTTVPGGGQSGLIPPGARTTVVGTWSLPTGERPAFVIAVATMAPVSRSAETVSRRVPLADVAGA